MNNTTRKKKSNYLVKTEKVRLPLRMKLQLLHSRILLPPTSEFKDPTNDENRTGLDNATYIRYNYSNLSNELHKARFPERTSLDIPSSKSNQCPIHSGVKSYGRGWCREMTTDTLLNPDEPRAWRRQHSLKLSLKIAEKGTKIHHWKKSNYLVNTEEVQLRLNIKL